MSPLKNKQAPPAFQFYPREYLSDLHLELMTLEEQGAYMRLLCHAWENAAAGSLPNDDEMLAQLSRLGKEKWERSKANILRAFEVNESTITLKKLVQELKKQKEFSKLQREKAKKRWENFGTAAALPRSNNRQSRGNALQSSSSSADLKEREEEKKKRATQVPQSFSVTPEMEAWAQNTGVQDLLSETEKFLDHHRANGSCFLDWNAAWRKWIRNAVQFQKLNQARSASTYFSSPNENANPSTGKYDHLYE